MRLTRKEIAGATVLAALVFCFAFFHRSRRSYVLELFEDDFDRLRCHIPRDAVFRSCDREDLSNVTNWCDTLIGQMLASSDHVAVIARGRKDSNITWVETRLARLMHYVVMDNTGIFWNGSEHRSVPVNPLFANSNENDLYLFYVRSFYDCLPRVSVFLHEHEADLHDELYMFGQGNVTLKGATIPQVLSRVCWEKLPGYYSLAHTVVDMDSLHPYYNATRDQWKIWLQDVQMPEPLLIFHCCTNFMVQRHALRRRPRQFYADLQTLINDPNNEMRNWMAYIMEYSWEYIVYESALLPAVQTWAFPRRMWVLGFPQFEFPALPWPSEYPPVDVIFGCRSSHMTAF